MIETHPFGDFIPAKTRYLMIGSFVTKPSNPYEWFYANGRNQFWPIMESPINPECVLVSGNMSEPRISI